MKENTNILTSQTLKEQAYNYIKHKIKRCTYLPGEAIHELRIVEETGIGRTPVREALLSLKEENLVEVRPRKGTFAPVITESLINEMYQIRQILEPTVAIRYKQSFDKGQLLDYDELFEHLDINNDEEYYDLDIAFHQYILDIAHNPALSEFYRQTMFTQYRIGSYNSICGTARKENYYSEHHAIITALLEEDDKKIHEACMYHISRSHIISLQTLKSSVSDKIIKEEF